MEGSKKIMVIVCAQFFPVKHIAAYRLNALVKYWDHSKYDIYVYCYGEEEKSYSFEGAKIQVLKIPSMFKLRQQAPGIPIWRHKLISLNNRLVRMVSRVDYPGWAKLTSEVIFKNHHFVDLLFTSFSPIDAHLSGIYIKNKFPDCFWIADMRDEMSQNQMIKNSERLYYRSIEKKISKMANLVTAVSRPILEGFESIFDSKKCKFLEIRNGFDHDFQPLTLVNEAFTIVYAGTFYGQRKPDVFFASLKLLQSKKLLPENLKIQFIGTHKNFEIPIEFQNDIEFIEQITNSEVIHYLAMSDCQLLIHPTSEAKGIFTGKLFDYLSVQRPILAIVDPKDVAAELIISCNAGFVADFHSMEEICTGILNCIKVWRKESILQYHQEKIKSLHRKHQVNKLLTFVNDYV